MIDRSIIHISIGQRPTILEKIWEMDYDRIRIFAYRFQASLSDSCFSLTLQDNTLVKE